MSIIHGIKVAEIAGELRVVVGPDEDRDYAYRDDNGDVSYIDWDLLHVRDAVAVTLPDVPDIGADGFYDNPATKTLMTEGDLDEVIADGVFALAVKLELEAELHELATELRSAYYNDGSVYLVRDSSDPGVWLRMARAVRA